MSTTKTTATGLDYTIDPLDAFKGIKASKLFEATGLLPYFAIETHLAQPESVEEAWNMLTEAYGFGDSSGSHWGTVEDMLYKSSSEEDPDMEPLVVFNLTEEIQFMVYQYAIVAVTDGEDTIIGRMD